MKRFYLKFKIWIFRKWNNLFLILSLLVTGILVWQSRFQPQRLTLENSQEDFAVEIKTIQITSNWQANDSYAQRHQRYINVCKSKKGIKWPPLTNKLPQMKDSPLISKKYRLTYCPVGKVASSFYTRYMIVMESNGTIYSPYDIPIENAGRERVSSLKSLNKTEAMLAFLSKSTKIVFGRDPYSRILSAYIDKMFSPNPFYWKHWGERALKLSNASKADTPCASDVTFTQFVRLVLNELMRKDVHLMPVSLVCNMCGITYDIIGKLETTRGDLDHLAKTKNISSAFQYSKSYKFAAALDAVRDSVMSAFDWKKDINACISLDQMGRRIWRKLQLRGMLDSRIAFPFPQGQMESIAADAFIAACREAIVASTDRAHLKKQKEQVMAEAYGSLSLSLLQSIHKNYHDDFLMFGYDPFPSNLFQNRNAVRQTGFLQWSEPWSL